MTATSINFYAIIDGKCVVNTTPHPITFLDLNGEIITVPTSVEPGQKTSPWVINAKAVEETVGEDLVRTVFVGTPEGEAIIDTIEAWAKDEGHNNLRIIGSIIAAQAYPGRVLSMCPAPRYERVAPAEKRMTAQKFTVFTANNASLYLVGIYWRTCGDFIYGEIAEEFPRFCFTSYDDAKQMYDELSSNDHYTTVDVRVAYLVQLDPDKKFVKIFGPESLTV